MEDAEYLPPPDVLAAEIVDQLEAALEEFRGGEEALGAAESVQDRLLDVVVGQVVV